jgi:hypothetical protein
LGPERFEVMRFTNASAVWKVANRTPGGTESVTRTGITVLQCLLITRTELPVTTLSAVAWPGAMSSVSAGHSC